MAEEGKAKTWGRRIVSGTLICLTGGVALSALDDLSIYHSCSRFGFIFPGSIFFGLVLLFF